MAVPITRSRQDSSVTALSEAITTIAETAAQYPCSSRKRVASHRQSTAARLVLNALIARSPTCFRFHHFAATGASTSVAMASSLPGAIGLSRRLRRGQDDGGAPGHLIVVPNHALRLLRVIRRQIVRPAEADRLIPQLRLDLKRSRRAAGWHHIPHRAALI